MAGNIIDVPLICRLLSQGWALDRIVKRTGATEEQIARVRRNFSVTPRPVAPIKKKKPQMDWSSHGDELRRLFYEGKPTILVAAHFGVTRNAVIGAWFRLGLPKRSRPAYNIASRPSVQRRKREKAAPETRPLSQPSIVAAILARPADVDVSPPDLTGAVPILVRGADGKVMANDALTSATCRWWLGDVLDPRTGFCPEEKVLGLPYCEAHARRAFQPPVQRRQRSAQSPKPERVPTVADAEVE